MEETAVDLLLASKEGAPHGMGGSGTLLPARPRLDTLSCPPRPCAGPAQPSVLWCPAQPDSVAGGGAPPGGQATVGMFMQDPLLAGSPFLRAGSRDLERPPDPSEVMGLGLCPCFPELQSGHPSLFPDASRLSTGAWASPTFS